MVEEGDADKPIFITEGGWNDHPRWTRAVKPAQRIQYTLQAYQMAQEWDWCQAIVLWAFRYPWAAHSYLDYFTFVTPDFEPKPIYLEVQQRHALGARGRALPPGLITPSPQPPVSGDVFFIFRPLESLIQRIYWCILDVRFAQHFACFVWLWQAYQVERKSA
jgi:hypothetical protein